MANRRIRALELLQAAALADPDTALAAWRAWARSGAEAAADPVSSRWLPLVRWNLRDAPLEDASRELLGRSCEQTWSAAQRLLAGARPALEAFGQAGIATVLLKGAALAFTVYARPDLRPFGDVDVLVEPRAALDAQAILAQLGWQPLRPVSPRSLSLRHSLGFTNADDARVDLHWHALAECCGADDDRDFWHRAEMLRMDGLATRVLSPPDQLLHVCVHGLRWTHPPSSHWIADAVVILRRAGQGLHWGVLLEEARRRRLTFQMRRALGVVRQAAPVDIPAAAVAGLAATPTSSQERLEGRVKRVRRSHARLLFLFWCVYCRAHSEKPLASRLIGFARALPALIG